MNDLANIKEVIINSGNAEAMKSFNRIVKRLHDSRTEFADNDLNRTTDPDARFVVLQYNDLKTTVRCTRPLKLDQAEKIMEDNQGRPGYHQKKVKI